MLIDQEKIRSLLQRPPSFGSAAELRRQEGVFWVGSALPVRETLETIYESDSMKPVDLFILGFEDGAHFRRGEELVRLLKKNFRGFLLGRFFSPLSPSDVEGAYGAGIDLFDLPQHPRRAATASWQNTLDFATTVFPRWSVLSTLSCADVPDDVIARIDALLGGDVLPLLTLSEETDRSPEEIARAFEHLAAAWQRAGAVLQPLRPLLHLATPLVSPPPRRGFGALIERVEDARLRTSCDLRRLLRVRRTAESFESAGL